MAHCINLLPPDIVRLIFDYATLNESSLLWNLDWMRYTAHVCAPWRRVALDHAVLWKYISIDVPSWVIEEKIRRSKVAPLTVTVDLSKPSNIDFSSLWRTIPRICDLSIKSKFWDREPLRGPAFPELNIIAECLEQFSLNLQHRADRPRDDILPWRIFAGGTPKLRSLHLQDCGLTWDSPFLAGLTSLHLNNSPSTARPSLAEVISALDNMRNLEKLVLHHILPSVIPDINAIPIHRRARTLPSLTLLDIVSTAPECTQLIQHFAFPSLASATFKLDFQTEVEAQRLIANISGMITEDGLFTRSPIRSIECASLYSDGVGITLWDSLGIQLYTAPKALPRLQFSLHPSRNRLDGHHGRRMLGELSLFRNILPLDTTLSLTISQSSYDDWIHHVGQFKSLEFFRAKDETTSLRIFDDLRVAHTETLHLPALRVLVIERCTFGPEEEHEETFEKLVCCLETRAHYRYPLDTLCLVHEHGSVSEDQLSILMSIVPNVLIPTEEELWPGWRAMRTMIMDS